MKPEDYENITKLKKKIRKCKFCNNKKDTEYKIKESERHGGETKVICNSCLEFITGMHMQANPEQSRM